MRILQVEKQRWSAGQMQQVLLLVKGLHKRGHEVVMVCQPESKIGEYATEAGIKVLYLSMEKWRLFVSAVRLAFYLWKNPYDIIHPHGARDHILSVIAHYLSPGGRVIRTKHNVTRVRNGYLLYNFLTHNLIGISKACCEELQKGGVPSEKIHLIYSGVDLSSFTPKPPEPAILQELGIVPGDFVIGTLGRLSSPRKNTSGLLHAAVDILKQVPHARFLLAGNTEQDVIDLADTLGLSDRVIFAHFRTDVPDILACMDLYVQPSLTEGLGSAMLQAMAMGKPIVGSRTGGIREAVIEGETGMLCEVDELAPTIIKLIKDPQMLKQMGLRGRERVLKLFDLERLIDETETLYRATLRYKGTK
jgi:glycosyltransferase involved in cell wall biosynthesis